MSHPTHICTVCLTQSVVTKARTPIILYIIVAVLTIPTMGLALIIAIYGDWKTRQNIANPACPQCKQRKMIPADTPAARKLMEG
jgi:hypothetical protein